MEAAATYTLTPDALRLVVGGVLAERGRDSEVLAVDQLGLLEPVRLLGRGMGIFAMTENHHDKTSGYLRCVRQIPDLNP